MAEPAPELNARANELNAPASRADTLRIVTAIEDLTRAVENLRSTVEQSNRHHEREIQIQDQIGSILSVMHHTLDRVALTIVHGPLASSSGP